MGEQLSVTAGFWQPVSRYEHIRHPTVKSAASDKGWGVPGLAGAAFSRSSLENELRESEGEPSLLARSLARFRKQLRESLSMLWDSFVPRFSLK